MSRHIEARFEIASWDETPFEDGDEAPKLTEALVAKRYDGDIKGTSTTKWLMAYSPDKSALFVGIEHIAARSAASRAASCCSTTASTARASRRPSCVSRPAPRSGEAWRAPESSAPIPAGSMTLDLDGAW